MNSVMGFWKGVLMSLMLWAGVLPATSALADIHSDQNQVLASIDQNAGGIIELAQDLWGFAELGYQENKSTQRLQDFLAEEGFKIRSGVAGLPTAFVAQAGHGKPIIGILAEFDALPGMSQAAVSHRQPLQDNAPGQACGHHLFGSASAEAGVVLARWLKHNNRQGTIRVYGTPAEEGGSGKVYMTRAGLFDDVDVVLHWHPSDSNRASAETTTANKSGRFRFYGQAAHAASAPEKGRSALDGVEAMDYMVNMMREHVPQESRIHYVITDGGDAPNIVPEFAEVYYYVRHPKSQQVVKLFERVVKAAQGAALGTGTRMEYEVMHGNHPVLPNKTLAALLDQNMRNLGGIHYTAKEQTFAREIRATLIEPKLSLGSEADIQPSTFLQKMGSTDVGDVSWNVPTAGFGTATWVPGTPAHSWQAVAAGGMSIGHKGMLLAAKVLATTAIDLFDRPELIGQATEEFKQARGPDFHYEALLGNRKPPLDYRN